MMTIDKPLVSIVTVVFNGEEFLEETIQSVINQSYNNIEYIIIDGGSTDNTVEIIKKYENRISHWISEKDSGIYDAMNKGILQSSGDVIGIINSGDSYNLNTIQLVVDSYKTYGSDFFYFGNVNLINNNKKSKEVRSVNTNSFFFMRSGMSIPHPAVFVPSKVYKKCGLFRLNYSIVSDYDFLYRLTKVCNIKYIYLNKILANFKDGGISSNVKKVVFESHYMRINNGMPYIESGIYLLKALLFYYISVFLHFLNFGFVLRWYRKYIIKTRI